MVAALIPFRVLPGSSLDWGNGVYNLSGTPPPLSSTMDPTLATSQPGGRPQPAPQPRITCARASSLRNQARVNRLSTASEVYSSSSKRQGPFVNTTPHEYPTCLLKILPTSKSPTTPLRRRNPLRMAETTCRSRVKVCLRPVRHLKSSLKVCMLHGVRTMLIVVLISLQAEVGQEEEGKFSFKLAAPVCPVADGVMSLSQRSNDCWPRATK